MSTSMATSSRAAKILKPTVTDMTLVSLIIPTLNEEHFATSLDRLLDYLLRTVANGRRLEILVVDDSSPERQKEISACLAAHGGLAPAVQLQLIDGARRGKGNAIKLGARASRGDIVFVIDADMPAPLEHIEQFVTILERGEADAVIAERPMQRSLQQPIRLFLSRTLSFLQHAIVFQRRAFNDTQCGFKAFRGDLLRSLAARQIIDGGMYDIEYLYVTLMEGRKVERVSIVPCAEIRPSKIKIWKCIRTDLFALIQIKSRGLRGKYSQ